MLTRLGIENYRSCVRTSLDPDPHLSVLIGPNGSGKTNVLPSVMLLNKLTGQNEALHSIRPRPGSSRVKATFSVGSTSVQLSASFDKVDAADEARLHAQQKWNLRTKTGREFSLDIPLAFTWVMGNDWTTQMSSRYFLHAMERRTAASRGSKELARIPPWVGRAMFSVAQFCAGIKYYGASQFTNPVSCPSSFEIEEAGQRRRLLRLRGHERVLYDMYSAEQSRKNSGYDRFLDIVGRRGLRLIDNLTFRRVRTSATEYSVRVGGKVEVHRRNKLLIIPQFKIGRLTLSPNQLSEGTFKTLALLFHVVTQQSQALLIEEPEVCVHQGLLSSILELIKSYSQNRQTIISTHSDFVLDHVDAENVYGVTLDPKRGTIVRHITKTMSKKELSALRDYLAHDGNLGDYWREGGFGDRS